MVGLVPVTKKMCAGAQKNDAISKRFRVFLSANKSEFLKGIRYDDAPFTAAMELLSNVGG